MYIEKHISNLKQYIKDDEIIEKDGSDFANFCKGHIDDIQAVLNELEKKNKELKEAQKETMQIYSDYQDIGKIASDLDEKVQKLIEKLEEDIKVNQENYKTNTDGFEEYWRGCIDTEQEILSILKGEKE